MVWRAARRVNVGCRATAKEEAVSRRGRRERRGEEEIRRSKRSIEGDYVDYWITWIRAYICFLIHLIP
jgi:hypothetical protein